MTALVALSVAILALVISCAAVLALIAWQRSRHAINSLAEYLSVDSRLEQLTVQTLAAMREAARREGGIS